MRIAYLIDNLGSGGAQRQAVELAVRLRAIDGVDVDFATYRDVEFFQPRLEEAGIGLARLRKRGTFDPAFPWRLRDWVRERAPDVVHAFLPLPVFWAALARGRRRSGPPVWLGAERSAPLENVEGIIAWMTRFAYRRCDAITANSVRAVEALKDVWRLPESDLHYLPNGIDLEEWDRRGRRPCPVPLAPGRFQLALVGRLSGEKNHLLFLDAFSRVPPALRDPVDVWFVGADGPDAEEARAIERDITRRGLASQVRRLPPTPELAALMARLDAVVLPSRFEGAPNVVLEAMSSRLPVIASDVGDVPSLVVPGHTGWQVRAGDAAALARALGELFEASPEQRKALGAAARERVEERFQIDVVAQMHLDLYRRLADERRGGPGGQGVG